MEQTASVNYLLDFVTRIGKHCDILPNQINPSFNNVCATTCVGFLDNSIGIPPIYNEKQNCSCNFDGSRTDTAGRPG